MCAFVFVTICTVGASCVGLQLGLEAWEAGAGSSEINRVSTGMIWAWEWGAEVTEGQKGWDLMHSDPGITKQNKNLIFLQHAGFRRDDIEEVALLPVQCLEDTDKDHYFRKS